MPLDVYTKETIEGLQRGENVVMSGNGQATYEKFEKEKEQMASGMAKRLGALLGNKSIPK